MGVCHSNGKPSCSVIPSQNLTDSIWEVYEEVKILGEGGFGVTFMAKKLDGGDIHALKLIPKSHGKGKKNVAQPPQVSFEKEVVILKSVNHKGICKFYDAYEDHEYFCIALEYLSGGELFDRILQLNHYSEKVASKMVQQMLQIIQYLHSNDIVHLDIKPENFVLAFPNSDDSIKLIDFGLAIRLEEGRCDYPACGTKIYKSPEMADPLHFRDAEVLKMADSYSFAILLFTMLVGRFPGFNRKKELVFPKSCQLSQGAMDLMNQLSKRNFRERLSISDALKHPWVVGDKVPDIPLTKEVLLGLKHFQFVSVFQKAMVGIMADNLSNEDRNKLESAFEALDEDKNGSLDVKELCNLLCRHKKEMGLADEEEALAKAMKILQDVDLDKNGTIDKEEWLQVQLVGSLMRKKADISVDLEGLFNLLDVDGDGFITVDELSKFLAHHDAEDIERMFLEADENEDGVIEFDEFLSAMRGRAGSHETMGSGKSLSNIFHTLSNKSYRQLLEL